MAISTNLPKSRKPSHIAAAFAITREKVLVLRKRRPPNDRLPEYLPVEVIEHGLPLGLPGMRRADKPHAKRMSK